MLKREKERGSGRMYRSLKIVCAALAILLLAGCVPHTELNEKAIVLAIGIDYEDGLFKACFQYYNPSGAGGATLVDNSQPNVLTAKGEGENVYGALEDASFRCGKELMLGVTQIIIIGEEAANHSVEQVMNFSKSYFQSHPDMMIAVSEGKACDLMQVKFNEGIVSTQKIKFMMQNAEKSGIAALPSALDLFRSLESEQRSICLPRLRLIEPSEDDDEKSDASEDGKNIEICGGVLIYDGKAAANTDIEVMSGLEMLCCKTQTGTVTVDYNDEKLSIGLVDIHTELFPSYEDGVLTFEVKVKSKGRYLIEPHNGYAEEDNKEMGRLCGEQIIARMTGAIEETVLKYGADPFQLEKIIRHYDNKLWNEIKDNYTEELKNCRFDFETDIEIDKLILAK